MVPYPTPIAQQLRRACKCDTFSQLCARAFANLKASADYASVSFTDWNLGQLLASLQSSGVEKDTVVVLHACVLRSVLPVAPCLSWRLLADGRVWVGTMATSWASVTSGARKPASTSRRTSLL